MLKYGDMFSFSSTVYLIFLRFYVMARFGFLKLKLIRFPVIQYQYLQSKQVKRTPQDSINELII